MVLTDYEVKKKIFESSNSIVYRALRKSDSSNIILKALKKESPKKNKLKWFKREFETAKEIRKEFTAEPYDLIFENGQYIMVMEDFGGDSLSLLGLPGKLSIDEFLKLAIKISELLAQLHNIGIIHKDINPSNIVLNKNTEEIRIIDFGISTKLLTETQNFDTIESLQGTLTHISPEQSGRMNRQIDYRSDLYSLGITLYELLTGQLPFESNYSIEIVYSHLAKLAQNPKELNPDIPEAISKIILKLIEKNPEDRYQSAIGLKTDLEYCLDNLEKLNEIDFELAQKDKQVFFNIPEKLYGRENEIDLLMNSYNKIIKQEDKNIIPLVLISGLPGIGKSVLAQELFKPISATNGFFISGKFDQFQRHVPYSAIISALDNFINIILSERDEILSIWKDRILSALGKNGQVIIDLLPNLEFIIGKQAEVPELSSAETQNRLNMLLVKFISAISIKDNPLIMFIDDWQWADPSSINILSLLMKENSIPNFLIIGAYRSNEVDKHHPFIVKVSEFRKDNGKVQDIELKPLHISNIQNLIEDTLINYEQNIVELANLVESKTLGNPFFIKQFIISLYENEHIKFDYEKQKWNWEISLILDSNITENVVSLIAEKVKKLSHKTFDLLSIASCIGGKFDLSTLALYSGKSIKETLDDIWPALNQGIIKIYSGEYKIITEESLETKLIIKFQHDRIHQAVYSLINEEEVEKTSLKLSQILLENHNEDEINDRIFEIVNLYNTGSRLIENKEENDLLTKLNYQAGKKSKLTVAYNYAYEYFEKAIEISSNSIWNDDYEFANNLYLNSAESALLVGKFDEMENLVNIIIEKSHDVLDTIPAYGLLIEAYQSMNKPGESVKKSLNILRQIGVDFPDQPNHEDIMTGFMEVQEVLKEKNIDELIYLPDLTDKKIEAAMTILFKVSAPAYNGSPLHFVLMSMKLTFFSIKYGHNHMSAYAYVVYAVLLVGPFSDIVSGRKFGELAVALNTKRISSKNAVGGSNSLLANGFESRVRVMHMFHFFIRPWTEHYMNTLEDLRKNFRLGLDTGSYEFGGYSTTAYIDHLLYMGTPCDIMEEESNNCANEMLMTNQKHVYEWIILVWQLVQNLAGKTNNPYLIKGDIYDETIKLPEHMKSNNLTAVFMIHHFKSMIAYIMGKYEDALTHTDNAKPYVDAVVGMVLSPQFYFFDSLIRIANLNEENDDELLKIVESNQEKMKLWATHCPMNFMHKYNLVKAEILSYKNEYIGAEEYYSKAISGAINNGYQNEAAIANELTSKYYEKRKLSFIAQKHLEEAYKFYNFWQVKIKTDKMKKMNPDFHDSSLNYSRTIQHTTTGTGNILDIETIIKTSQAISREIILEKLLTSLMDIVVENAGAEKAILFKTEDSNLQVIAKQYFEIELNTSIEHLKNIPFSIINYVFRSERSLVIDNASTNEQFQNDEYISENQIKSVLCLPLKYQGRVTGILYMENNLIEGAFVSERLELLKMILSQAAISIENATVYENILLRTKELETSKSELLDSLEHEKELRRLKSRFISLISHEYRTPLAAIMSTSEIIQLMAEKNMTDDIDKQVFKIRESIKSMTSLLENIIAIGDDNENISYDLNEEIQIKDLCIEINNNLMKDFNSTHIFEFECNDKSSYIITNKDLLKTVIYNLLSNAIKFSEQGSKILVKLSSDTNDYIIKIKDSGCGISESEQEKVFEPFYKSHKDIAIKSGSGLGLAIVKKYIKAMKAKINLNSKVDIGSEFTLRIPKQIER